MLMTQNVGLWIEEDKSHFKMDVGDTA